ncbi:MAG: tetratricopeptide repeat protein [Bacteroidota bacterium]
MSDIHNYGPVGHQIIIKDNQGTIIFKGTPKDGNNPHTVLFYRILPTEEGYQAQLELRSDTLGTHQLLAPQPIYISPELKRGLRVFAEQRMRGEGRRFLGPGEMSAAELLKAELDLGEALYTSLFPEELATVLHQMLHYLQGQKIQSLALIFSSEEEEMLNLPFEMMRQPGQTSPMMLQRDNFLIAHSRESSLEDFKLQGIPALAPPLRILYVTALPEDLSEKAKFLELERETIEFIAALDSLRQRGMVVFEILDIASLENIREALSNGQHHILHISGHGVHAEQKESSTGYLYLEDENGETAKVSGEELAAALKDFSSLKLIMLSACETARAEEKGVVGALVQAQMPAVIGMRYPVTDPGARLFTGIFYDKICHGFNLNAALFLARQKLLLTEQKARKDGQSAISEWFTPFLYLNQYLGPLIKGVPEGTKIPIPEHFSRAQETILEDGMQIRKGFVGRKRQLARLAQHFKHGQQAVCIYGLGGLGKTALATRFATNYQNRSYKVIQFFGKVEVPTILDRLMEEAAFDLGASQARKVAQLQKAMKSDAPSEKKLQYLLQHFLQAQKIILLFDNFETNQEVEGQPGEAITDPDLATFLAFLIQHLPQNCFLLLTTRYLPAQLPIQAMNLDQMSLSEVYRILAMEEGLEKRLTAGQIKQIHTRLGGHPFAFDLVKAYLKEKPAATWEELDQDLAQLSQDAASQRKLMLDHIWALLNPEEQELLRVAALFRTAFPPSALAWLTDYSAEEITVSLARFNVLSFYFTDDQQTGYIHRLAAAYVINQQHSPESRNALHLSIAGYLINEKKESLEDFMEARWHYRQAEAWDDYADLSFALEDQLSLAGHFSLAKSLNQQVLDISPTPKHQAGAMHNLGIILQHEGDYDAALAQYEASKKIKKQMEDMKGLAISLHQIGMIYQYKGDYTAALAQYEASKKIKEQIGDIKGVASSLHQIGIIYQHKGDYTAALAQYEASKKIKEQIGDLKGVAGSLHQVGMIYQHKGDYTAALSQYEASKKILEQIGDIQGVGKSLHQIGMIYQHKGDYTAALAQYEASKKIKEQIGDLKGVATSLHQIGMIYQEKGDYDGALEQYESSKKIAEQIGDIQGGALSVAQMGVLSRKIERYPQALVHFIEAHAIFKQIGTPHAEQVMGNIQYTRQLMGEEAYKDTLKELGME